MFRDMDSKFPELFSKFRAVDYKYVPEGRTSKFVPPTCVDDMPDAISPALTPHHTSSSQNSQSHFTLNLKINKNAEKHQEKHAKQGENKQSRRNNLGQEKSDDNEQIRTKKHEEEESEEVDNSKTKNKKERVKSSEQSSRSLLSPNFIPKSPRREQVKADNGKKVDKWCIPPPPLSPMTPKSGVRTPQSFTLNLKVPRKEEEGKCLKAPLSPSSRLLHDVSVSPCASNRKEKLSLSPCTIPAPLIPFKFRKGGREEASTPRSPHLLLFPSSSPRGKDGISPLKGATISVSTFLAASSSASLAQLFPSLSPRTHSRQEAPSPRPKENFLSVSPRPKGITNASSSKEDMLSVSPRGGKGSKTKSSGNYAQLPLSASPRPGKGLKAPNVKTAQKYEEESVEPPFKPSSGYSQLTPSPKQPLPSPTQGLSFFFSKPEEAPPKAKADESGKSKDKKKEKEGGNKHYKSLPMSSPSERKSSPGLSSSHSLGSFSSNSSENEAACTDRRERPSPRSAAKSRRAEDAPQHFTINLNLKEKPLTEPPRHKLETHNTNNTNSNKEPKNKHSSKTAEEELEYHPGQPRTRKTQTDDKNTAAVDFLNFSEFSLTTRPQTTEEERPRTGGEGENAILVRERGSSGSSASNSTSAAAAVSSKLVGSASRFLKNLSGKNKDDEAANAAEKELKARRQAEFDGNSWTSSVVDLLEHPKQRAKSEERLTLLDE